MLGIAKRWVAHFLAEKESRRENTRVTQTQMARACIASAPTCFIVDDGSRTQQVVAGLASAIGASALEFRSSHECLAALCTAAPELIFLDVALHNSDAIDVIRGLSSQRYAGAVQLFSGDDAELAVNVHAVGKRYHLNMLPIVAKGCAPSVLEDVLRTHLILRNQPNAQGGAVDIDLAAAIDNGWVQPWYQPKIDIAQRALVGVEALARLNHPEYGLVPPSQFLRRASLKTMHKLTEYMIVHSMRDWGRIRETGFVATMAVNVGVACMQTISFAKLIRETRPADEDWPGILLEITEDQVIRDIGLFHEIATQLQIYGVSFSIDDFGAGYSSLARLKHVPFSEIKIDGEYVRGCSRDPKNAGICKAVIDLAHVYGATATAECVDDKDDLLALHRMNCDVAQGFLLCRPMPIDKLVSTLRLKSKAPQRAAPHIPMQRTAIASPKLAVS